jgi:hypothetical protein
MKLLLLIIIAPIPTVALIAVIKSVSGEVHPATVVFLLAVNLASIISTIYLAL